MLQPHNPPPPFPAGPFAPAASRDAAVAGVAALPGRLRELLAQFPADGLGAKYINWTVRQIVNHVADSHINAFIRFKWAMTEATPTIKPYDESAWAALPDADADPEVSLRLLEALHEKWVRLMHAMTDADFAKSYYHPESGRMFTLADAVNLYDWHGRHHAAQIQSILDRPAD